MAKYGKSAYVNFIIIIIIVVVISIIIITIVTVTVTRPQTGRRTVSRPAYHKLRLNFGLASIFTAGFRLNGFPA